MRSLAGLILATFALGLLAALGLGAWLVRDYQRFVVAPVNVPADGTVYVLAPGTHVRGLACDLAERGVIDNPFYFQVLARLHDRGHRIQAGEYRIGAGTTPTELLDQLIAGRVVQHSLTLVEGWSFAQVMAAVAAHEALAQTLPGHDPEQVMAAIDRPGEHPEGRFFPDTYRFPRGTSDVAFLRRAYEAMARQLAAIWAERDAALPLASPHDALVLASIVEKETGAAEERARIAGVFVRRLERGMRLQTDPTVIYGLGPEFDGDIRSADLRRDTPYNTYTRKGLPPTPIAMPGAAALRAAVHPAPGAALYFVAKGDGTHHFSATLEEHDAAVARYVLKDDGSAVVGGPQPAPSSVPTAAEGTVRP